ncbi:MAG: hypothetical protein OIF47_08105 [Marinibacterium sp.]|nr:hypothetical protein [Marinibacterium sp.]
MTAITRAAGICVLGLGLGLASPTPAQEDDSSPLGDFFSDMLRDMAPQIEEWEDLMTDLGPALRDFLIEMGPALEGIFDRVQDWTDYEPPQMLPNGDIILRKKTDPAPEPEAPEGGVDI